MSQEYLNKIAKGALIVFLGMIISKFLTYFYRLIIARYLGPQDYGLVSIGFAILGITSTFALLGLPQGVIRYIAYYQEKKEKTKQILKSSLTITIPTSLVIATLLFVFSSQISLSLFHNKDLSIIIKSFSILLPFIAIANNLESVLKALKQVKTVIVTRNISESSIQLLATAILFFLGFGVLGAVFGYAAAIISSAIIFIIISHKKGFFYKDVKKEVKKEEKIYSELLSFSWPLLFAGTLTSISTWIDSLLIGYFLDAKQAGIYNAALPTASLLLIIPSALTIIFMPIITELYAKSRLKEIETIYKNVIRWILLFGVPLLSILIIFPEQILNILFGPQYTSAFIVLIIISIGYFLRIISVPAVYILQMLKKTKIILINTITTLILSLILNIILIPKLNITGAAISIGISSLFGAVLLITESHKFTKLNPFNINQSKFIVSALLSALIIFPLTSILKSVLHTIILMAGFLTLYIVFLIITKSLDKEDVKILILIKQRLFNIAKR